MIKKSLILVTLILACSGCAALKQCAPNSWNLTYYQSTVGDPHGNNVAIGI